MTTDIIDSLTLEEARESLRVFAQDMADDCGVPCLRHMVALECPNGGCAACAITEARRRIAQRKEQEEKTMTDPTRQELVRRVEEAKQENWDAFIASQQAQVKRNVARDALAIHDLNAAHKPTGGE